MRGYVRVELVGRITSRQDSVEMPFLEDMFRQGRQCRRDLLCHHIAKFEVWRDLIVCIFIEISCLVHFGVDRDIGAICCLWKFEETKPVDSSSWATANQVAAFRFEDRV